MEGLRGLAVILVFFVHYHALSDPWIPPSSLTETVAHILHEVGYTGVDLFFLLSGYLIYGSLLSKRPPFLSFMARRIERLYPTFTVVFLLYLLLSFLFPAESKLPGSATQAILYLLENFFLLPGMFDIHPMITVAWSLSYEMLFYLLCPLVIASLNLRQWRRSQRVIMFLGIAFVLIMSPAWLGERIRLTLFLSGVCLHEVIESRVFPPWRDITAVLLLLVSWGVIFLPLHPHVHASVLVVSLCIAFFSLCHLCFVSPESGVARVFTWTPLRWLGNMSYSYYLIHGLVLKGGFLLLAQFSPPAHDSASVFWVVLPGMFTLTVLISAGLFLAIERPFSLQSSSTFFRTIVSRMSNVHAGDKTEESPRSCNTVHNG